MAHEYPQTANNLECFSSNLFVLELRHNGRS